jgi:hypothetical protein
MCSTFFGVLVAGLRHGGIPERIRTAIQTFVANFIATFIDSAPEP